MELRKCFEECQTKNEKKKKNNILVNGMNIETYDTKFIRAITQQQWSTVKRNEKNRIENMHNGTKNAKDKNQECKSSTN